METQRLSRRQALTIVGGAAVAMLLAACGAIPASPVTLRESTATPAIRPPQASQPTPRPPVATQDPRPAATATPRPPWQHNPLDRQPRRRASQRPRRRRGLMSQDKTRSRSSRASQGQTSMGATDRSLPSVGRRRWLPCSKTWATATRSSFTVGTGSMCIHGRDRGEHPSSQPDDDVPDEKGRLP
jgi:hypothetical protein